MPVFLLQYQYHFVGTTPIEIHRENLLKGKNIRVAILEVIKIFVNCQRLLFLKKKFYTFQLWPFMYIDRDLKGNIARVDGFVYQMILWLSKKYDFT